MQTLCWCIEAILLITIASAPWAFGAVHPPFELWVGVAIALVLVLWGLRTILEGRVTWPVSRASNWFTAGLLTLFLIANFQTMAIPQRLVDTLSPNTSATVQALIPQQREMVLAASSDAQPRTEPQSVAKVARWSVGNKLSLNPGGSYLFSVRMLALAAIFLAVTSLPMPSKILFRLSVAAAAIGTAFALFGIAQYFSANKNQLYWFFDTNGNGFAAYRNRNHYPFFANMALGLTIGLLLDRFQRRKRNGLAWLTQDIWLLWLGAAIVFLVASIFLCASRGGFVAMVMALSIGVLPQLRPDQRLKAIAAFAGLILCTALLLYWLGFDLFSSRLTTLADSTEMREESRWHLWTAAGEGILKFPLFGAGGDTFRYWETVFHQNESWNSAIHQGTRADNEFIDVFLEFGIFGCASLIMMAIAVLWQGFKLSRSSGLANGAFIALIAVIVHSCLDFGLRVPASAVLATMIAALVCNLSISSDKSRRVSRPEKHVDQPSTPPVTTGMRLSAVGFAITCCLVGALIVKDKLRQATAFNLQAQGMRALASDDFERCVALMVQSTEVLPEDVNNQVRAVQIILRSLDAPRTAPERESRIATALGLSIQARDLCPLAFEPYVWLAEGFAQLRTSQTKLDYLAAAHRLHPSGSLIAFQLGAELAAADRYEEAWPVWRESIRFNSVRMGLILDQANQRLSAEEIVRLVLPPNPPHLFEAANMADRAGNSESAKVYLRRVLELLPIDGSNVHEQDAKEFAKTCELVAKTNLRLNNIEAAIAAYQQAISFEPGATEWRQAFAQLLIKEERYDQAARELRTALVFEPDNEALKALRDRVMRLQKESNKKK